MLCLVSMSSAANTGPLKDLEGNWYVQLSNFPMWIRGHKQHPVFTYSVAQRRGIFGLKDVVSYRKKGRIKTLEGFDRPLDAAAKHFTWRGRGLLALFKSRWEIVCSTPSWMLIHFEKTLATSEGYDVISRKELLDEDELNAIRLTLKDLGIPELTTIPRP